MKIKIIFLPRHEVNPNTEESIKYSKFPPLGIATLKAFLEKNQTNVDQDDLDIKVFNHNETKKYDKKINLEIFNDNKRLNKFAKTKNDSEIEREAEKMLKLLDCKGFDIIGFSLNIADNPSTVAISLALAKIIKEKYEPIIVVGRTMKKEIMENILKTGLIDYGIVSTPYFSIAEIGLLNFCKLFERGHDIKNTPGLLYIENDKLLCTKEEKGFTTDEKFIITRPNFDGLPLDLYINKKEYETDWINFKSDVKFLPYFFIRGCSNNCAFCTYSLCSWVAKSPEEVVNDVEYLSKKYNTKCFFFLNAEINPTYEYAEKFAEELINRDLNILWSDCATVNNMDGNLLKKLKKAGAVRLVFGVESGSPKIMKYINKPFSLNQAENILKKTLALKMITQIDVICGFPYEAEEDINSTIEFIRKNKDSIMAVDLNKFYLNGLLQSFPERYGIIRLEEKGELYGNWSTIPFNENYGLKWKNKVKQTIETYEKITKAVNEELKPPMLNFNDVGNVFFAALNPRLFDKVIKYRNRNPEE